MATYTIIPQPAERGFNIEIIGVNGTQRKRTPKRGSQPIRRWMLDGSRPNGRCLLMPKLP
jgi:hypothetical protein